MSEHAEVLCPHCGAPSWTGYVCCIRAACDERDGAIKGIGELYAEIALMRGELDSQERAHAEERERWQAIIRHHQRAHAYDLGKLQWLGHGHHGGKPCASCATYEAKAGAEPPIPPLI